MHKGIALGSFAGLLVLVVLDSLAVRLGLANGIVPRLVGTMPWVTSRALGITAFVALTAEVVLGLSSSTGVADRLIGRARLVDLHGWMSGLTLSLVTAHALTLLLDAYAGLDLFDLAVPGVIASRRAGVALGILSAYVGVALHLSSRFRARIGAKAWRRLHMGSFVAFVAAAAHGILAGTDASARPMRILFGASLGVVAVLTALRISRAMKPSVRRA